MTPLSPDTLSAHLVETHSLQTLHTILSTGSPLKAQSYEYVYRCIKADVLLGSISGVCTFSAPHPHASWCTPSNCRPGRGLVSQHTGHRESLQTGNLQNVPESAETSTHQPVPGGLAQFPTGGRRLRGSGALKVQSTEQHARTCVRHVPLRHTCAHMFTWRQMCAYTSYASACTRGVFTSTLVMCM